MRVKAGPLGKQSLKIKVDIYLSMEVGEIIKIKNIMVKVEPDNDKLLLIFFFNSELKVVKTGLFLFLIHCYHLDFEYPPRHMCSRLGPHRVTVGKWWKL